MTVINALVFNEYEGAIVADEQVTVGRDYDETTYNSVNKLFPFEEDFGSAVIGITGDPDFLTEGLTFLKHNLENLAAGYRPIAEALANISTQQAWRELESKFEAELGFSVSNYREGFVRDDSGAYPLSEMVINNSVNLINDLKREIFSSAYVLLERDAHNLGLYVIHPGSGLPERRARPCCTLGSGFSAASPILEEYIGSFSSAERNNIDTLEGITVLLRATNSAKRNPGVGGAPTIAYMGKDKPIQFYEDSRARMASEFVAAYDHNYISKNNLRRGLNNLLFNEVNLREANDFLHKTAGKYSTDMNLFLRDYRELRRL